MQLFLDNSTLLKQVFIESDRPSSNKNKDKELMY